MRHIQLLFNKIDSNDRGSLSAAEFAKVLVAEVLAGYFSVLDLDVKVVWALFRLLVADNVQRNRIYDRKKQKSGLSPNDDAEILVAVRGRCDKLCADHRVACDSPHSTVSPLVHMGEQTDSAAELHEANRTSGGGSNEP